MYEAKQNKNGNSLVLFLCTDTCLQHYLSNVDSFLPFKRISSFILIYVSNTVWNVFIELPLFTGNIDQAQYCDRIKGIIELLGSKLSLDELTKIWRIQVSNQD